MRRSRQNKQMVERFTTDCSTAPTPAVPVNNPSCPLFTRNRPATGCAEKGKFSAYPNTARCPTYNPGAPCKQPCAIPTGPYDPYDSSTWTAAGLGACLDYKDILDPVCKCNAGLITDYKKLCDDPGDPLAPINYHGKSGSLCAEFTSSKGIWTKEQAAHFRKMCPQSCGTCPNVAGTCTCLGPDGSPSTQGAWGAAHQKTGYDLRQVGVDDVNLSALSKCSLCIPDPVGADSSANRLGNIWKARPGVDLLPKGSYCSCSNGTNLGCCSGRCHLNNTNGDLYCGTAGWWGYCERNEDCGSGNCMKGMNPFYPNLSYCYWAKRR